MRPNIEVSCLSWQMTYFLTWETWSLDYKEQSMEYSLQKDTNSVVHRMVSGVNCSMVTQGTALTSSQHVFICYACGQRLRPSGLNPEWVNVLQPWQLSLLLFLPPSLPLNLPSVCMGFVCSFVTLSPAQHGIRSGAHELCVAADCFVAQQPRANLIFTSLLSILYGHLFYEKDKFEGKSQYHLLIQKIFFEHFLYHIMSKLDLNLVMSSSCTRPIPQISLSPEDLHRTQDSTQAHS